MADFEKKDIKVDEFLRNLKISDEDKDILLMCLAVTISQTAFQTARSTTAACMGLSEADEEFNAFFNNNIAQIVNVDENSVYRDLKKLIMPNFKGDEKHE